MNHEHILWLSLSDLSVPCVQTLWEDSLIYLGLIVLLILCYSFIAVSSRRSLRSLLRCIVCSPLWEDSHNMAQSRCSSCCFLGWSGGANYNITTGIRCSTANIQSTVDLQKNKKKQNVCLSEIREKKCDTNIQLTFWFYWTCRLNTHCKLFTNNSVSVSFTDCICVVLLKQVAFVFVCCMYPPCISLLCVCFFGSNL